LPVLCLFQNLFSPFFLFRLPEVLLFPPPQVFYPDGGKFCLPWMILIPFSPTYESPLSPNKPYRNDIPSAILGTRNFFSYSHFLGWGLAGFFRYFVFSFPKLNGQAPPPALCLLFLSFFFGQPFFFFSRIDTDPFFFFSFSANFFFCGGSFCWLRSSRPPEAIFEARGAGLLFPPKEIPRTSSLLEAAFLKYLGASFGSPLFSLSPSGGIPFVFFSFPAFSRRDL